MQFVSVSVILVRILKMCPFEWEFVGLFATVISYLQVSLFHVREKWASRAFDAEIQAQIE